MRAEDRLRSAAHIQDCSSSSSGVKRFYQESAKRLIHHKTACRVVREGSSAQLINPYAHPPPPNNIR